MQELKIEEIKLSKLKPYENNAKIHTDEQVEQIIASIKEFGFNDPLAVWTNADGVPEIVEGHGRYLAAEKMGIEAVPCIYLDRMTDEQRRAYTHVHNQLTINTGFDFMTLDEELANLNFDFKQFGFDVFDTEKVDFGDFFEDADEKEKEAKKVVCPNCGEEIEL